jgi:hypothetical protein
MSSARMTDAEIRALGWQALIDRLGPSGALRFAMQTERGYGDYAALRHRMLGSLSVQQLLSRMKAWKRRRPGAARRR